MEIIATIPKIAAQLKDNRLRRAEESRREEYNREQRRKLDARIDREKSRREELVKLSADWERAKSILEFCDEVERSGYTQFDDVDKNQYVKWLNWAKAVAEINNPFHNGGLSRVMTDDELEAELDCDMETYWLKFPYPEDEAVKEGQ